MDEAELSTLHEAITLAKDADWEALVELVFPCSAGEERALSDAAISTVPDPRAYGVLHQIAYWGELDPYNELVTKGVVWDLSVLTKDGKSARDVAVERNHAEFVKALDDAAAPPAEPLGLPPASTGPELPAAVTTEDAALKILHDAITAAKGAGWPAVIELVFPASGERALTDAMINTVPTPRAYGVLHQIAYWGELDTYNELVRKGVKWDLSVLTKDGKSARDLAEERDHEELVALLDAAEAAVPAEPEPEPEPLASPIAVEPEPEPEPLAPPVAVELELEPEPELVPEQEPDPDPEPELAPEQEPEPLPAVAQELPPWLSEKDAARMSGILLSAAAATEKPAAAADAPGGEVLPVRLMFKLMNLSLKMMNFVFKMTNFAARTSGWASSCDSTNTQSPPLLDIQLHF